MLFTADRPMASRMSSKCASFLSSHFHVHLHLNRESNIIVFRIVSINQWHERVSDPSAHRFSGSMIYNWNSFACEFSIRHEFNTTPSYTRFACDAAAATACTVSSFHRSHVCTIKKREMRPYRFVRQFFSSCWNEMRIQKEERLAYKYITSVWLTKVAEIRQI